jgi:hypothetical protein
LYDILKPTDNKRYREWIFFWLTCKIFNNCISVSNLLGSLMTFKDYLKGALGGSEVKKIVSELSSDALGSLSKAAEDAPSKFSSFGIGIGLAFFRAVPPN